MEQEDKRIEDLVNKLMSADSIEQAPDGFTDNVMSKIEALSNAKTIAYRPLIPKYILWLVGAGFITLVGYMLFIQQTSNSSLFEKLNLPEVSLNLLEGWSFELSNTFMYAVVLFAIMLSIQIPLLKQYFNSRMAI